MWFFSSRKARPAVRRRSPAFRPQLEALEDRCVPSAAGSLDPTFGNGAGYVTTPIGNPGWGAARTALIQPDGKIIATGNTHNGSLASIFGLARYNADGSLDTSFGSGGTTDVPNTPPAWRSALYPQAGTADDGKIVMMGEYNNGNSPLNVVRFTANGTLDPTFGTGGIVQTSFSVGTVPLNSGGVVVTSADQIVAASIAGSGFVLARYNDNGSLDTSFGTSGEVYTPLTQFSGLNAVTLLQQANGKLLEVGDASGNVGHVWLLVQYNADGSLDTSFGNQGIATAPFGSGGQSENAAIYPTTGTANDGKIVIVGDQATWEAVRFNTNGSLDNSFGAGGEAVTPWAGRSWGVAVDANGRVIIAGGNLARLNVDGTVDTSFGIGGIATTPVGATGVAIYPNAGTLNDGKIVTVGGGSGGFAVARYLGDAVPSPSFSVTGFPSSTTAGIAGSITVTADDASGNLNPGYTGTVHFTSSDPQAVLPADYTFTAADQGVHTFSATLLTAGSQSITATDTTTSTMIGSQAGITVNPAAATHFLLSGPSSVNAGTTFSVKVTAVDAYGNVATGYTGTVKFTSSDRSAILPSSYTFTAADSGAHTFTRLKLRTKGKQTITVTDTLSGAILGRLTISVN